MENFISEMIDENGMVINDLNLFFFFFFSEVYFFFFINFLRSNRHPLIKRMKKNIQERIILLFKKIKKKKNQ